ncbi:hypothetical protein acsn021_11690 [Anaerocolumna cellulosilytica]|uniref:Uncharacterized protein n=1 Tax=Anaerocolumna cellulosilytica TaxID=433286 RepID=A0A6S6R2Q3_9FIRM|nr:hypothetical protein [Anaerocolumna cellulosilytica]MBB5196096.1 hypothetical protein [Anaerocolumna cellulosilytica]BCJ93600.1 hypothetical protein acsn021_11690 [Anaerocolumna cellulosilytica]
MIEYLWDGEMDYGWEGLSNLVKCTSEKYADSILKVVDLSPNEESRKLITIECLERFLSISNILAEQILNGYYYQYEDIEDNNTNAQKLNSWILLGTLTETTLQMFLAFYLDDFRSAHWQQWIDFEIDKVQTPLIESVTKLVDEGIIDSAQGKSLKKAVKDTIKEHTREHEVPMIMLDELIQFYKSEKLFDEDEYNYLREIQSNRNGIHSFKSRIIGSWGDLQYSVRFFCYLLEWVINHLPDIPDEEY